MFSEIPNIILSNIVQLVENSIRVHPFIEVFTTKVPLRGSEAQDPTFMAGRKKSDAINAIGI